MLRLQPILALLLFSLVLSANGHDDLRGHIPEPNRPFEHPHGDPSSLTGVFHTGWESNYFSEGRDNLDGDSLWVSSFELGWEFFSTGVWYGSSPNQSYEELQLSLAATYGFGDFEIYSAYTHLQFLSDDLDDNEIGAGLAWSGLPLDIELAADVYYSFDAEGAFAEFGLGRAHTIVDKFIVDYAGIFGVNQNYISDGHDGVNYAGLRLGVEYVITDNISLTAHGMYSWAVDASSDLPGDELLRDLFHGGVGLRISF